MRRHYKKLETTQRQPPRACGVVELSPSPELGVSTYRYLPGYRVRDAERVYNGNIYDMYQKVLGPPRYGSCAGVKTNFGQLWDRTELVCLVSSGYRPFSIEIQKTF